MIHLPRDNSIEELKRVLTILQQSPAAQDQPQNVPFARSSGGSVGGFSIAAAIPSTGIQGPPGPHGPTGPPGSPASEGLLVGAECSPEVLFAPNGDVLTDENGYALIGVKVSTTILTGMNNSIIEVLNDS